MNNEEIWKLAEAYLNGTLNNAEQQQLGERVQVDAEFAHSFEEHLNLLRSLKGNGEQKQFRKKIADTHKSIVANKIKPKTIELARTHWRTAAVAACIAMLTSLTTFWLVQHNNKKIASQYSLLRRDLETYKRSQNKIIGDIKKQTTSPHIEARYTGTGFALTNDGYLVTSYHVVNDADSIFVQHKDGNYYKALAIASNPGSDIVILKIEAEDFSFTKSDIPYSIAKSKSSLGSKVFTLGFPQDEIVYNEGYISAKNGYSGDTAQYRLDIPAGPGQSGAPVVDSKGNIIGIITGKESQSEGTTYAVSTIALIDLLNTMTDSDIKVPSSNKMSRLSRENQIEKLEYYTCAIKVYKK